MGKDLITAERHITREEGGHTEFGPAEKLTQVIATYLRNFLSGHTREAYLGDFKDFGKFLEVINPMITHPSQITKDHVIAFRDKLRDEDYSPNSVNRKLSAISSLFRELKDAQVIEHNPAHGIKRPPARVKRERLGFSDEEVLSILSNFDEGSPTGLTHLALFSFLFYTGCRISEALAVRIKDIEDVDKVKVIHIRGKGSKIRAIPVHPKLNRALNKLIEQRVLGKDDFLFTSPRGTTKQPLDRKYVHSLLKRILRRQGLSTKRSLHSSRRTVISNLLENGSRIEVIADLAGHSNVNTTMKYRVREEKLEDNPILTLKYK